MALDDSDIAELAILLSPERLAKLMRLTGSTRSAIELHQDTLRLGASLLGLTGVIEIALRNAISENLAAYFGTSKWLDSPPPPFIWRDRERDNVRRAIQSARRAEYSKLSQAEKGALDAMAFPAGRPPGLSHAERAIRRQQQIVVSEGKVIAELTFYFWKRLYSGEYAQELWRTTLKRTFPYKKLTRMDVAANLEAVYQARNRLAHHEPVLYGRFLDTMTAIDFVAAHLQASVPSGKTPLEKLIAVDIANIRQQGVALHARFDSFRVLP